MPDPKDVRSMLWRLVEVVVWVVVEETVRRWGSSEKEGENNGKKEVSPR